MLDTLDNLKLGLRIDTHLDDDRLGQLADAAEAFIAAHCGRTFAGGTFTEYFPGGSSALFLANWPVDGVTSVNVDPDGAFGSDTVRAPASYVVHPERGIVQNRLGPFAGGYRVRPADFPRAVRVVYTTPTSGVPAGVRRAFAELVGHWYRLANTYTELGQTDKLTQTADGTVTAYPWGVSGGFRVPKNVLEMLALYRVPVL